MNGQKKSSGCGCFAGGCAAVLVVLAIIALVVGGVIYSFYQKIKPYTAESAAVLPVHKADPEEFKAASAKIAVFKKAYDAGLPSELELSGNELNTLIVSSPQNKELAGKFYLQIQNGVFILDTAIPLSEVPLFRDRFVNAKASFTVSIEEGKVTLVPQEILLSGQKLPTDWEKALKEHCEKNLQAQLEQDPQTYQVLRRIKSLELHDDKVRIATGPPLTTSSASWATNAAGEPVETQAPSAPPPPAQAPGLVEAPAAAPTRMALPPQPGPYTCAKNVAAYDAAAPTRQIGYFAAGTKLQIDGPSTTPGMMAVTYTDPAGKTTQALCKAEDLAQEGAAP